MFDVIYNILQPSLKDLTLHYTDTESFVLSYSEGKVSDEHMDLNIDLYLKWHKFYERTSSIASQASLNLNKEQLVNNFLELTINEDRKLIEAAIRLYMICKAVPLSVKQVLPDLES